MAAYVGFLIGTSSSSLSEKAGFLGFAFAFGLLSVGLSAIPFTSKSALTETVLSTGGSVTGGGFGGSYSLFFSRKLQVHLQLPLFLLL